MKTAPMTHTPRIHLWKTSTPLGRRWRYRHRCSCGKRDPERYDLQEAEYDQRVHEREVGR